MKVGFLFIFVSYPEKWIQASVIHSRILSRLDAEGSDRYTFNEDTKYAINSAIETLVTMLNQAFAENKLAPRISVS